MCSLSYCSYNRGPKCVHSAMKYWTGFIRNPWSECTVSCVVFVLLWPLFFGLFFWPFSSASGSVSRLYIKVGVWKDLRPLCCIVVELGGVGSTVFWCILYTCIGQSRNTIFKLMGYGWQFKVSRASHAKCRWKKDERWKPDECTPWRPGENLNQTKSLDKGRKRIITRNEVLQTPTLKMSRPQTTECVCEDDRQSTKWQEELKKRSHLSAHDGK